MREKPQNYEKCENPEMKRFLSAVARAEKTSWMSRWQDGAARTEWPRLARARGRRRAAHFSRRGRARLTRFMRKNPRNFRENTGALQKKPFSIFLKIIDVKIFFF